MGKKVTAIIKLQIAAGKANPAPPVGPALGQHGLNIMAFCKDYNARTSSMAGSISAENRPIASAHRALPVTVSSTPGESCPTR